MGKSFLRYRKYFFVGLFLTLLSQLSLAQSFTIDTSAFFSEEEDIHLGPYNHEYMDELEPADEGNTFVPNDIIFVPSEVLYSNRWDTLYIRTGRTDYTSMHDSINLLLNNPAETPFHFPILHNGKVISKYGPRGGRFHAGTDIKLELGDTVVSAFDGKVRIARVMSGYGKMVVIRHDNGLETVYGHLSKILVDINQQVTAGAPIGLGGRTGRASTTHLHFETRILGEHFDPAKIVDFDQFSLKQDTLLVCKDFWKPAQGSAVASQNSQTGKKYHVIRQGDTLSKISRQYHLNVKQLCKLNGISENKILQIGARLRVS